MYFEIVKWNNKFFVRKKFLFFYRYLHRDWPYFSWELKFLLEDYHGVNTHIEANLLIEAYINSIRERRKYKKEQKELKLARKNPMVLVDEVYYDV
jgi:hypothetical protein